MSGAENSMASGFDDRAADSSAAAAGTSNPVRIVVINAGVSDPSTTRLLAERIAQASLDRIRETGIRQPGSRGVGSRESENALSRNTVAEINATVSIIDLAQIAPDVARSIIIGSPLKSVQPAIDQLAAADALIVATPVYKAGISGILKSFLDILDNDLVVAKPTILAATAGTARHALVVDDQLRPLFAFLRALPVPTSLFAAPEDWADPAFGNRIDRAAVELAQLVISNVAESIKNAAWEGYQHRFDGNATRAERTVGDVDFDTSIMRLARGGR
jgi:FMN reductase